MEGWRSTTIDEACNVEYGTRVVQKRDGGSTYPVYGGGGATFFVDTTNRANRVVVSRFGMSEECTRYVDGEFFLNDSGLTLSPEDPNKLLPAFLDRLILGLNDEIFALGKGAAQKNLDVPGLRELRITYPISLSEQRRIVAILDEAFEGIATAKANAEKNLQNAREVFESKLYALLGRDVAGWPRKTLREIAVDFGRGKSKLRPRNDPKLYGGPYPFIQTGDVRGAEHLITEYTQTYSEAGLAQSKLWPRGTLCITIAANIAETGVLDFEACFPDSVIGVVVDERQTSSKYLEYMLHTVKADLKAKGKGSAQDNINLATFENERFPFPDLGSQARIVSLLDDLSSEVQRLEGLYSLKLTALDELKKSLLHQAFSGALTDKSISKEVAEVA
jgi:type I restriction enzyme S subunit